MFDLILMIVGGISFLIAVMDDYHFAGFKIKNEIIKSILYLIIGICGLLFFIMDVYDLFKMITK